MVRLWWAFFDYHSCVFGQTLLLTGVSVVLILLETRELSDSERLTIMFLVFSVVSLPVCGGSVYG